MERTRPSLIPCSWPSTETPPQPHRPNAEARRSFVRDPACRRRCGTDRGEFLHRAPPRLRSVSFRDTLFKVFDVRPNRHAAHIPDGFTIGVFSEGMELHEGPFEHAMSLGKELITGAPRRQGRVLMRTLAETPRINAVGRMGIIWPVWRSETFHQFQKPPLPFAQQPQPTEKEL